MRLSCLTALLLFVLLTQLPAQSVIPAGTTVAVMTIDPIESKRAEPGKTFRASLDQPLVAGGNTIAPKGADVLLKVVESAKAGKIKGKAALTVVIASINVGDRAVALETEDVRVESTGKGRSSAKKIGLLSALGAGVGAVAGGGTGAAIGAAAGAGAGAAVALATGPEVKIPSESRLSFVTR